MATAPPAGVSFITWFKSLSIVKQIAVIGVSVGLFSKGSCKWIAIFSIKKNTVATLCCISIKDGHQVFCSRAAYLGTVKIAIINQAEIWIAGGDTRLASIALNEVKRLDGHFEAA